jgi:gamma-glutamyltranspeptidase/glutathione hydrolase
VALESGVTAEVRATLEKRGHRIVAARGGFGGYQGIWWDRGNDVLIGGTEPRKDGCALGY